MAFSYAPGFVNQPALSFGSPINTPSSLNYGSGLRTQGATPQQVDYDLLNQQSQGQSSQGQSINPMQMYDMYQKFAGSGASSSGSSSGLSGLLSTGGGTSAGLGGSGLIGSAGGATSAASSGGASFGLGGSLVGGSGAVGGSTFAAGAGSGAAAGGSGAALGGGAAAGGSAAGGAAAGGMGGAAAAGGPWAALAAIIMFNEENSRKKGYRAEDRKERTMDQLTGKVLTQDIEHKWGPKEDKWTGGKASKWGLVGDQKGASQIMSGRIAPGIKSIWNEGSLSKIRKLF